ncbi:hypothetical protein NDU88_005869 [Pleurodeles waltl]|uniref:Uncharacterized protein n=1 Tax=Pleurodeles waltl TaxID=8319 RepID=A0AAV7N5K2_PLEWA|nr:hypothetical protein NDU88_005869 [Pleurodeles waltl]
MPCTWLYNWWSPFTRPSLQLGVRESDLMLLRTSLVDGTVCAMSTRLHPGCALLQGTMEGPDFPVLSAVVRRHNLVHSFVPRAIKILFRDEFY